jgi:double-strand break repair protein MRE11
MIPEWMDLVIWGNEHEAIPRLVESLVGTYRIYQPGSSVVTSLCDRESISFPKSMGLIEIRRTREFRLTTLPFTQLRLFKYAEVTLSDERFGLDPNDPKVEEKIKKALIRHVGQLIKSTLEEYKDKLPVLTNQPASTTSSTVGAVTTTTSSSSSSALASASSSSSSLVEPVVSHTRTIIASETASELQSQRRFVLKKPRRILIRLRVEHSGFPTVNTVRLGTHFVNEVANPTDLILFAKQKAKSLLESRAVEGKNKKMTHGSLKLLLHEGAEEELQKIKIEDLVADSLQNSNKQLNLLPENEMAKVSFR